MQYGIADEKDVLKAQLSRHVADMYVVPIFGRI